MMTSLKLFETATGIIQVRVNFEGETVWLNQSQIAEIFDIDRTVVSRHLSKIFKEQELDEYEVCAFFAQTTKHGSIAGKTQKKNVKYYNLDAILAVGYRTNSKNATQFRIRATQTLKQHLLHGYTLNKERLFEKGFQEFEQAVALIKKNLNNQLSVKETQGMLSVITQYADSWILLQKYDEGSLKLGNLSKQKSQIFTYDEACSAIQAMKEALQPKGEVSETFGEERNDGMKGVIQQIYQTFDDVELYPSLEEKASALLYFTIKNHPFIDGNKKIGALLFVIFLAKNKLLYNAAGHKRIDDATLTALTLLIASSEPSEKEMLLKLTASFLQEPSYENK